MRVTEERIFMKMLHIKNGGKITKRRPITRWIDQIKKDIEMRGENWEEIQQEVGDHRRLGISV